MKAPLVISLLLLCAGCSSTNDLQRKEVDLRELPCHWFITDTSYKYYAGLQRAKLFTDRVAIYSIAANQVYGKDPSLIEDIPFPNNEVWVEIKSDNAIDDDIGFAAKAWRRITISGENELVIAYRGTDDFWKDFFKGNLVFAKYIFGRTQFDAALDFASEVIGREENTPTKIVFVGHSLGGGLAEYVQRLIPSSKAISFDTSPNQGRLYSLFSEKYPQDSIRMYEKGEILSYLRYVMSPDLSFDELPDGLGVKAIWVDFYSDGFIDGHSMRDLSASLIKLAAYTGNQSAKNVLSQLEDRPRNSHVSELKCPSNSE